MWASELNAIASILHKVFPPFWSILRQHCLLLKNERTGKVFVSTYSSSNFITKLLEFFIWIYVELSFPKSEHLILELACHCCSWPWNLLLLDIAHAPGLPLYKMKRFSSAHFHQCNYSRVSASLLKSTGCCLPSSSLCRRSLSSTLFCVIFAFCLLARCTTREEKLCRASSLIFERKEKVRDLRIHQIYVNPVHEKQ